MTGEVDDSGVTTPISLFSGHILCAEGSPYSPDCVTSSGINKVEDGDCEGHIFKPIKEDRGCRTDLTGSTGIGSETALPANSASFMFKSWWDEGNEFISSSFRWDGRNPCVGKDDVVSRQVENWTEAHDGENFGCTEVEV